MVAVMKEEFLFRFKKYWGLQFRAGWWWWIYITGGAVVTNGESRGPLLPLIPTYIFWGVFIVLLGFIMDLSLYLPNQLSKTMFFMPISMEDKKKYTLSILWTKIGVISVFFGMSSLIFTVIGWFPLQWIICVYITGILWGIVVIFGDIQLRQDTVGKQLQVQRETYQIVNSIIYVLYMCSFVGKSLNKSALPPWWFQVVVWLILFVLIVYTVRVKMPLVLCGHDYETVHRRDDM